MVKCLNIGKNIVKPIYRSISSIKLLYYQVRMSVFCLNDLNASVSSRLSQRPSAEELEQRNILKRTSHTLQYEYDEES